MHMDVNNFGLRRHTVTGSPTYDHEVVHRHTSCAKCYAAPMYVHVSIHLDWQHQMY